MMNKKILFITPGFTKGGAENQLFKVASYLKGRGYDIEILSFIDTNDFADDLKRLDIKFTTLKAAGIKGKLSMVPSMISYVKQSKPDLMIAFMFVANLFARLIKYSTGIPLITSVRNNEIAGKYQLLYKLSYKADDYAVFNSRYAITKFVDIKLADGAKSTLINNAVEVPADVATGSSDGIFRWISVAHFRPQKDYPTLFKAISQLKATGAKFTVTVLGHTFGQEWPAQMLKDYQIEDIVTIRGFESNISGVFKQSDALVHSSLWEGTPNSILEAMSYGLPVVASSIPGVQELLEDAGSGLLFEVSNADDLVTKMTAVMNADKEAKQKWATGGRNHIMEFYEREKVFKQWEAVVTKVLAKR